MTGLLEKAIARVSTLSDQEQDAIAAQILESLEDESAWNQSLSRRADLLKKMGQEASEEHRRGETRPLEELIG